MVQIINPTKVGLAEGEEGFDLDLLNGNFQKINDLLPIISRASSALNSSQWDFTPSRFTKISVAGVGIVIADFHGVLKTGENTTIPANFNSANSISGVIPVGYTPRATVGLQQGPVFSGEGRGDNLQGGVQSTSLLLRSDGASFNRASNGNVIVSWNTAWACDV